ncbi:hypothetical protein CU669_07300 [Paramagnetospirillum kuznetsovii]|uniref:Uncharacterized protein n=1 Tax=Paramagnetospirillum kuznetsovii TaxID=2053833 RepID=A0A364NZL7_9PROT|nr:hypothetical protein [Paramagnetospirillum kuznetsovii]RAU22493.1 hypothetical protein CU669_07300 [Paramagnetospirillum kuznetsovii]
MPIRYGVIALGVCGLAVIPAQAQQAQATGGPMVITITKLDCSRLIQHQPSADVAYKPGVDVRGRPVASADTDPGRAEFAKKLIPDVLEIPITINPLSYAKRNTANQNKATAAANVASNTTAIATAKSEGTALSSQLSTLNTQLSTVNTNYSAATAANVASTGGSSPTAAQTTVRTIRQSEIDSTYTPQISSINSQITTVNSSIATNTATQTSLATKDTTLRQTYTDTNMATEGTLAGISAKGLDSTQMKVGTVKYDIARNAFTFNDQPMISEDQQKLAAACAKQGVK